VAFSPDSELLATAGADREAKVWAVLAASSS
jgi:WD40 repeat protein